jgi:hypothetical protein
MKKGDALVYAYLLDGKGGGEALDWTAIDNWNPSQGLLWIHLDSKMPETRVRQDRLEFAIEPDRLIVRFFLCRRYLFTGLRIGWL